MTTEELNQDLESSRHELLDLSNRNRLISCPRTTRGGIEIVDELAGQVFDLLYRKSRAMSFLPSGEEDEEADLLDSSELGQPPQNQGDPNRHSDARLQTSLGDKGLQTRLLRLYRDSRTLIEEQGINTLYLALGFVYWREAPSVERERRAPLLLLPVELHRSSVRERFALKYSGEELGANLSLERKFKTEFGIKMPQFPGDDVDPEDYFGKIRRAVQKQLGWRVQADEMQLGFFSFSKLLMYQDLDPKQWPKGKSLTEHPILRGLIAGDLPGTDGPMPPPEDADERPAQDLVTILDADGSQTEALSRARRAKVMVIQGPPGTGKSQTIANLIADAMVRGQTVLFVAEKKAALDVVKRRLDEAGLGPACLELHSRAAQKKKLLDELARTLDLGSPRLRADREQKLLELKTARHRLDEYARAVNEPVGESGVPPRIAYLRYRSADARLSGVPGLAIQGAETWTASRYTELSHLATELKHRRTESGPPRESVFWGSRRTEWMPGDHEPIHGALETAWQASRKAQATMDALSHALELPVPPDVSESERMLSALTALETAPDMTGCRRDGNAWASGEQRCKRILDLGDPLAALRRDFDGILLPEAWGYDVLALRGQALSLGRAWYRFFSSRWRAVRAEIAGLGVEPPRDVDAMLAWCDAILAETRLRNELDGLRSEYLDFFEDATDWAAVDWPLRRAQAEWSLETHRRVSAGEWPDWTLTVDLGKIEDARSARRAAQPALEALAGALASLGEQLHLDPERLDLRQQPFEALATGFEAMVEDLAMLQPLTAFNRKAEEVRRAGLRALADFADDYPRALDIVAALERARYDALIRRATAERPALANFDRDGHEATAARFRELDRLKLEIDRQRAALAHFAQIPRGGGGRLGVLRTEMAKKSRHMAIRALVGETGPVIQKIKPVFLMSPLSVAQFLPPGSVEFDLVVFDEASQVKVVDGYGAIARGDRLIVVGDSKQLPPSNFFEALQNEENEEHAAANIESLLKKVESQVRHSDRPMLRWHYRSRHESLIAFSNQHFYGNGLVAFPSPVTNSDHLGLSIRHVPGGVYRRGERKANNPIEARHVAGAVMAHARLQLDRPTGERESLMVATFSTAQREAIEVELDLVRHQDPDCEEFFSDTAEEPFDVKNLESVQGDERDVVFISVGYGRDKDGRVTSNFGPLNGDGGDRRLNVLCSRAKNRCVVFTNILSSDIAPSENPGVNALRNFLYFAEHGDFDRTRIGKGDPENVFEIEVKTALERHGHTVDAQVGCVGYRIDLAIRDPRQPGRHLLGIECDGASYHSAKSARDRDRLRQEVLERRGWRIHRVWSTSWFHDPDKEIARVSTAIEDAGRAPAEPETSPQPRPLAREPQPPDLPLQSASSLYRVAKLSARLGGVLLHEIETEKLAAWLEEVVRIEGPVHFEVATRRVADATGTQRRGRRIVEAFELACRFAVGRQRLRRTGDILSLPSTTRATVRDRSELDPSDRKIEYVPSDEVDLGIKQAALSAHGIVEEEIPLMVARLLGVARTSANTRSVIEYRVHRLKRQGRLIQRGSYLEWADSGNATGAPG